VTVQRPGCNLGVGRGSPSRAAIVISTIESVQARGTVDPGWPAPVTFSGSSPSPFRCEVTHYRTSADRVC
jgi:hypothetical protein